MTWPSSELRLKASTTLEAIRCSTASASARLTLPGALLRSRWTAMSR